MGATLILAKNSAEGFRYARQIGLNRGSFRLVRDAHAIRGVRHAEVHLLPSFLERWDRHRILAALKWARTLEVFYVDPEDVFRPERGDFEHIDPKDADAIIEEARESSSPAVQITGKGLEQMVSDLEEVKTDLSEYADDYIAQDHEPDVDPETAAMSQQLIDGVEYDWGLPAEGSAFDFFQESNEQTAAPEQVEDPAPAPESRKGRRRSRCKSCGTLHFKEDACPEDAIDPVDVPEEPIRAANEVTQPVGGDIFDIIGRQ